MGVAKRIDGDTGSEIKVTIARLCHKPYALTSLKAQIRTSKSVVKRLRVCVRHIVSGLQYPVLPNLLIIQKKPAAIKSKSRPTMPFLGAATPVISSFELQLSNEHFEMLRRGTIGIGVRLARLCNLSAQLREGLPMTA
jgi:hypothetical protein